MKLIKINDLYNGSFFDDGGQEIFDNFYNDPFMTIHAFDDGEAMILPNAIAERLKMKAEEIEAYWDEVCPLIFDDYDPGGEHLTIPEIRRRES